MLSFEQLTTPVTRAQAEADLLLRLSNLGFTSQGWQSGSPQLTFVKLFAYMQAKFSIIVASLALGALNDTSTGTFLTRFSKSAYDNTRNPSLGSQHRVTHTTAAGEGPYTINIGDLIATDGINLYRNVADGVTVYPVDLTSAATVDLVYEAEIPGFAGGNAADGTLTTLVTTLAGVTISNVAPSLVRAGTDAEPDDGPSGGSTGGIRLRNSTKWATLAIDMPSDGYKNIALGVPGVGRAKVDDTNPRGPGTVDVYIAGPSAPALPGLDVIVEAAINARRSVVADVESLYPTPVTVTVAGIVFVDPAYITTAQAKIQAAAANYINTIALGGEDLDGVHDGVTQDGIIEAIRKVPGVKNVNLTSPTDDIVIGSFALASANVTGLLAQRL